MNDSSTRLPACLEAPMDSAIETWLTTNGYLDSKPLTLAVIYRLMEIAAFSEMDIRRWAYSADDAHHRRLRNTLCPKLTRALIGTLLTSGEWPDGRWNKVTHEWLMTWDDYVANVLSADSSHDEPH